MARHWQIVEADKALRFAEAEYKVRVEMAAKDLAEAKSPRLLAQIGSVSLTETSLEVDGRFHLLSQGIHARLETNGTLHVYSDGSGIDTRELYLAIAGPTWQESVPLDPRSGAAARQFAAAVNTATHHARAYAAAFEARVNLAQDAHRLQIADKSALEAARNARAVLELDPLVEMRAARKQERRGGSDGPKTSDSSSDMGTDAGEWPTHDSTGA